MQKPAPTYRILQAGEILSCEDECLRANRWHLIDFSFNRSEIRVTPKDVGTFRRKVIEGSGLYYYLNILYNNGIKERVEITKKSYDLLSSIKVEWRHIQLLLPNNDWMVLNLHSVARMFRECRAERVITNPLEDDDHYDDPTN